MSTTDMQNAASLELAERIAQRTAKVAVIGLGAVGLPLCEALLQGGLAVTGIDSDDARVGKLNKGESYIGHIPNRRTMALARSNQFHASSSISLIKGMDVVVVCVPTPLHADRKPDLTAVLSAAHACGSHARRGQLFVLESTTYPGTTRDVFAVAIQEALSTNDDLGLGEDFFVAYSPEREDPGRSSHTTTTTPKLVGGLDSTSTMLASALYRCCIANVVEVSTAEVAESAKMLENVFRCVNIALVNEMKSSLAAMGVDVWEAIEAAATKPFGYMSFEPGPGLGGHCIPVDPYYFTWRASAVGSPAQLVEIAADINTTMPAFVVTRITEALAVAGVSISNSKILMVGLAYKPEVGDTRESPSLELIHSLSNMGAVLDYSDPYVPQIRLGGAVAKTMVSTPLSPAKVREYDAVVIATAHAVVDYSIIARHAVLIIDTRNAIHKAGLTARCRLVKA